MTKSIRIPGAPRLWTLGQGRAPRSAHAVLVPGAQVPALPVDLPPKLRGGARERVAERTLSEALSLAPDQFEMHPLLLKRAKSWDRALVVDRELATAWRKTVGRRATAILPDFAALPTSRGLWTLEVTGETLRARLGPEDGFSAEVDMGLAILAKLEPPKGVLRLGDPHAALDSFLDDAELPQHRTLRELRRARLLPMRWAEATAAFNLRRPPSAALDQTRAAIKRWRLGAVAAMLGAAVWSGAIWLEAEGARAAALEDRRMTETMVRAHFVPTGPILDARTQVTAALEAALVPDVVEVKALPSLTQFQLAAPVLTRADVGLLSVAFRAEAGLEATLEATDFAVLDALVLDLQTADFLVEQLESRAQQSGGIFAKLRLELLE